MFLQSLLLSLDDFKTHVKNDTSRIPGDEFKSQTIRFNFVCYLVISSSY